MILKLLSHKVVLLLSKGNVYLSLAVNNLNLSNELTTNQYFLFAESFLLRWLSSSESICPFQYATIGYVWTHMLNTLKV